MIKINTTIIAINSKGFIILPASKEGPEDCTLRLLLELPPEEARRPGDSSVLRRADAAGAGLRRRSL